MSASTHAAVDVEALRFRYPGRMALDGLSFRVAAGELFGFLGPNGSGKTTLFRILATLLPPDEGAVRVLGHALPGGARTARRQMGVVFQSPSLDLHLTVEENLRHQGHLYGLAGRELAGRIDELLGRLELAGRRRDRAGALSGGLRRRAEIAKALLHRPRLLLLDEPSSGLDPGARRRLRQTLDELRREGITVLLTTHLTDEAGRCDRLVLLDRGRIVVAGTPAALEAEIGGDVVTLTPAADAAHAAHEDPGAGPAPALAAALRERFPELAPEVRDGRVRFEHAGAHRLVPRLAEAFPGRIEAVTVARPTLEDVFLRHTGHGLYAPEGAARAASPAPAGEEAQ